MTNKKLILQWKNLSIQFKSDKSVRLMKDMFLFCYGEKDCDVDGKNERLVVFDEGGGCDEGAPIIFCRSDKHDNCWVLGWNSKNNTFVKSNIGKFIKNEK